MQCLRCQTKMKQYMITKDLGVLGAEHKETIITPTHQTPHNPKSIYVCNNCGYMELNANPCESNDI